MSRIASLALALVAVLAASAVPASASRAIGTPGLPFTDATSVIVFGPTASPTSACAGPVTVRPESLIPKVSGQPLVSIDPTARAFGCYYPRGATAAGFLDATAYGYGTFGGTLPGITGIGSSANRAPTRFWASGGPYAASPSRCEYTSAGNGAILRGDPGTVREVEYRLGGLLTGGPVTCPPQTIVFGLARPASAIPLTLL